MTPVFTGRERGTYAHQTELSEFAATFAMVKVDSPIQPAVLDNELGRCHTRNSSGDRGVGNLQIIANNRADSINMVIDYQKYILKPRYKNNCFI